jgi:hypothetical protein
MKLGERTFLIGAITVVVVAIALWAKVRWQTRVEAPRSATYEVRAASTSPSQTYPGGSPNVAPNTISTPSTETERQNAINQLEATSIVFFGKVVDQNQLPVAGAQVTYTVHHLNFAGNSPIEGPVTDSNGAFEIRTQGPSITVAVSHPQFYKGAGAERQVDYGRSSTGNQFSPKPTRENPTLFRLVRKGETEPIVYTPSKEVRLPLDGRPVEIAVGDSLGISLRLRSASTTLKQNEFKNFDWSLVISAPNGGLTERLSPTDFQAPETGYIPEIIIDMVPDRNPRWSSRINKDYFVHFATGKYGRFQITVSGETGFCRFESYLNPSGSRNLEVDPNKLVRASSSP